MEDLLALGILEVQTTSMQFPARKRGRPRKQKENDDDDDDLQPNTGSKTITRKRGRPRKQKEDDHSLQTEIAEKTSTTTTTTTTRTRGRPKKLKEDELQQTTKTDKIAISYPWMRSRPILCKCLGLRPKTRYWPYFDNVEVSIWSKSLTQAEYQAKIDNREHLINYVPVDVNIDQHPQAP